MKKLFIFFGLGICSATAFSQVVTPFRLTKHNNILVKTVVNKSDSLDLMFQIAMEDAALSPSRTRKADHITFDKNGISDNNTIAIGKQEFDKIRFFDNELAGQEADGKIGTIIFKNKAFKIDFDNNQFITYDAMPSTKGYTAIPIRLQNEVIYLNVTSVIDGKSIPHEFYLQSGYAGGLIYDDAFSDNQKLNEKLVTISEKVLKDSAGRSFTTKQSTVPEMKIGKYTLKNVSAAFFTGELKMHNLSLFGADLLKRFNWIFDAERKVAYIKPSKYYKTEFLKIE